MLEPIKLVPRNLRKNDNSAINDRRRVRPIKTIASPITLEYRGKIYRGYFTLVKKLLIVSCGAVSKSSEIRSGQPEPQARQLLLELAQAGKLHQYGSAP